MPVGKNPPEVTGRSLIVGLLAVLIFTFAAAYIGLKTGNVIETSIPIAILAVFLGNTLMRAFHPNGERQNLLERRHRVLFRQHDPAPAFERHVPAPLTDPDQPAQLGGQRRGGGKERARLGDVRVGPPARHQRQIRTPGALGQ